MFVYAHTYIIIAKNIQLFVLNYYYYEMTHEKNPKRIKINGAFLQRQTKNVNLNHVMQSQLKKNWFHGFHGNSLYGFRRQY